MAGGHPQEDHPEAEEHCALDQGRHRNRPKTLGEPVSDVWHLSLILINIRAEDDPGEPLEQERPLLLLLLLAAQEADATLPEARDLGEQLLEGCPVIIIIIIIIINIIIIIITCRGSSDCLWWFSRTSGCRDPP